MKKSKLIITLGALILGVILILAVLLAMILSALLGQKVLLVITTESYEAVYDATPLTYHKWSLAEGNLKNGHTLYVTVTGTQTDVGQCENTVSVVCFVVCIAASIPLCMEDTGMLTAVILLSLVYTAASMINTSILSIFPLSYLKTGNVASVSGIMDFATYLGGGVASMIYGVVIAAFGYVPMFVSWIVISAISVLMLIKINRDRKAEV